MARVTVEDCVLVVPNRFELCLIASNRAKSILSGAYTELARSGEKPSVIALREIGAGDVDVDLIRDNIISGIKNRGFSSQNASVSSANGSDSVVEEINSQQLKEATFVSENIEVED
jgi:DNA-directed RNA polymerase subunit omega